MVTDSRVKFHRVRFDDLVTPFGSATLLKGLGCGCDPAEVELPRRGTENRAEVLGDADRELAETLFRDLACECEEAGERYHEEGLRLGAPVHLFLQGASHLQHEALPPPSSMSGANSKLKPAAPDRLQGFKVRGLPGGAGDVGLSG